MGESRGLGTPIVGVGHPPPSGLTSKYPLEEVVLHWLLPAFDITQLTTNVTNRRSTNPNGSMAKSLNLVINGSANIMSGT